MTDFVRLAEDPGAPTALREAIERASTEKPSAGVLMQVLGAAGAGVAGGLAVHGGTRAGQVLSRFFWASGVGKGVSVAAIFLAGAVAGGIAVHEHDVHRLAAVSTAQRASAPPVAAVQVAPVPGPVLEAIPAERTPAKAPEPVPVAAPTETRSVRGPRRESALRAAETGDRAAKTEHGARTTGTAPPESNPTETGGAPTASSRTRPEVGSVHAELASLRGIRDAVAAHHPVEALVAIETHRTQYPGSAFDEELLLFEAEARWAKRDAAVCEVLARFAARYPRSLLVRRAVSLGRDARCPNP